MEMEDLGKKRGQENGSKAEKDHAERVKGLGRRTREDYNRKVGLRGDWAVRKKKSLKLCLSLMSFLYTNTPKKTDCSPKKAKKSSNL